uniref:Ig-like domain-containing protein n=1 Tax=Maylandia zebra TaxID=106582 RepID=A0A3P9DAA0_9CICH
YFYVLAELRADRTAVPVGGSVTLTCSVSPSSSSFGWKYYWYTDGKSYQPVTNGQISVSEGGRYSCRGGRGEPVYYTELISIRPVVTLHPNWSEIYRGETITVRCEIHGGDTEWDYEWETNSIRKPPNLNEYRIISASSFNSENYRCKGRMKSSQHETTEWSDSVTLTVSDNEPRPVLTVSPSWLSPGASVTLNCEVEHLSAGWSFYWYKATHTAGYVCRAGRGDPDLDLQAMVTLTVSLPKPTVTLQPPWPQSYSGVIYSGETVTVRCEIQGGEGAQWTYEWSPAKLNTPPTSNEYTISSVSESDGGGYSCRATRGSSWTEWSDVITLNVKRKLEIFHSHCVFNLYCNTPKAFLFICWLLSKVAKMALIKINSKDSNIESIAPLTIYKSIAQKVLYSEVKRHYSLVVPPSFVLLSPLPLPSREELNSLMACGTKEFLSLLVLVFGRSNLSLNRLFWLLMAVCRGCPALSIMSISFFNVLFSATVTRVSSFMPTTELALLISFSSLDESLFAVLLPQHTTA